MNALSGHLFRDVERSTIDPVRHAGWLAKRALEYGRWADWEILVAFYGKPGLETRTTVLSRADRRWVGEALREFQAVLAAANNE